MKCPYCGNHHSSDTKFCPVTGQRINQRSRLIPLIIMFIVLAIGAIVFFLVQLLHGDVATEEVSLSSITPVYNEFTATPVAYPAEKTSEPVSSKMTPTATLVPTERIVLGSPTTLPTATSAPQEGANWKRNIDGMTMVYIPEGTFLMGSTGKDSLADVNEFPQHEVVVDHFWIDQFEVTNEMFSKFVFETGYITQAEMNGYSYIRSGEDWVSQSGANWRYPAGNGSVYEPNQPVTQVNFFDADAYCTWVGGRLPSEEEWEKAARGNEGFIFPWGDEAPNGNLLNMADQSIQLSWSESFNDGFSELASVGSYPAGNSPFNVSDMAGNVWEITDSCYSPNYSTSRSCNYYVLKGGSFSASLRHQRPAGRKTYLPGNTAGNVGFRCVISEP